MIALMATMNPSASSTPNKFSASIAPVVRPQAPETNVTTGTEVAPNLARPLLSIVVILVANLPVHFLPIALTISSKKLQITSRGLTSLPITDLNLSRIFNRVLFVLRPLIEVVIFASKEVALSVAILAASSAIVADLPIIFSVAILPSFVSASLAPTDLIPLADLPIKEGSSAVPIIVLIGFASPLRIDPSV